MTMHSLFKIYPFTWLGSWVAAGFIVFVCLQFSGCASRGGVLSSDVPLPQLAEDNRISVAREFFIRGRYQELTGNQKIALDFYKIAYEYDSLSRELCFFLCEQYKNTGDNKTALTFGLRGLNRMGDSTIGELKLVGEIYLRLGDIPNAISYYSQALALDESSKDVLYTLATIYEQSGDVINQSRVLFKLVPLVGYPERLVDALARIYHSLGDVKAIVNLYKSAWEETSYSYYGERLASIYESLGLHHSFLKVYKQLYSMDVDNAYYKDQLARSYIKLSFADSAIVLYDELLREYPDKEEYLFSYATLLFAMERYIEAKNFFIKLLELEPEHSTYHYYLGSVAEMLRDLDLAELEYNKAVELNPNILEYWVKLGIFLLKDERFNLALHTYERMVEHHQKSPYAWYLYGISCNRQAERLKDEMVLNTVTDTNMLQKIRDLGLLAIENFKKSVEINNKDAKVLFELGVALERAEKKKESINVFKSLISIDSNNATALNYLGYMLVEDGAELPLAIKLIDKALVIDPNNGAYLDSKGWWYFKNQDYVKAKEYIELALATGIQDVTILEHLALILENLGDMKSAREQWSLILKLDPNHKLAQSKVN